MAWLLALIFSFLVTPCFAQVGPGGYTPRSIYDVSDGASVNCSPYELEVSPSTLVCQNGKAIVTTGGGGGSAWTLTDGTHSVANVGQVTVTGGVVGGTSPNATLNISSNLDGGNSLSVYLTSQILDGGAS